MISFARALVLGLVASAVGCIDGYSANQPTDPSACTANVVPALALSIRDSVTQKPAASGVFVSGLVVGNHGTFALSSPVSADSLTIWFGTTSGTYNVALKKSGYQDVTRTGIVVPPADPEDCHPQTVTLDILLQRAS